MAGQDRWGHQRHRRRHAGGGDSTTGRRGANPTAARGRRAGHHQAHKPADRRVPAARDQDRQQRCGEHAATAGFARRTQLGVWAAG